VSCPWPQCIQRIGNPHVCIHFLKNSWDQELLGGIRSSWLATCCFQITDWRGQTEQGLLGNQLCEFKWEITFCYYAFSKSTQSALRAERRKRQWDQTCWACGASGTSSLYFQELFSVENRNGFERGFVFFSPFIPADFHSLPTSLHPSPSGPPGEYVNTNTATFVWHFF